MNCLSCLSQHQFLADSLQWRAQTDPDHTLYVLLNAKVKTTTTKTLIKTSLRISDLLAYNMLSLSVQGVAVCTATCVQLHKRAEKIAAALMERSGINIGENVVLLYPPGKSHILCPVLAVFEFLKDWDS